MRSSIVGRPRVEIWGELSFMEYETRNFWCKPIIPTIPLSKVFLVLSLAEVDSEGISGLVPPEVVR
jgi:hypothetical protein